MLPSAVVATHPPTPRRRALARSAGRVLTSPAATAGLALGLGTIAMLVVVGGSADALVASTRAQLASAGDGDAATAAAAAQTLPRSVLALVAPIAIAAAVGAIAGSAVLARGLWIPIRTVRGAPSAGAEPTTAGGRALEAVIGLVRTGLLFAVAGAVVIARLPVIAAATDRGAALVMTATSALATVAIAAVAVSVLEVAGRWLRLERSLAMTDRERRDEVRDTSGDPAARRARRDRERSDRTLVAHARVVVVGDELAIAIGWQPGLAPRIVARGRRLDARRIVAAARASQVPIVADAALAERLSGGAIAAETLAPIAALLAAAGVSAGESATRS